MRPAVGQHRRQDRQRGGIAESAQRLGERLLVAGVGLLEPGRHGAAGRRPFPTRLRPAIACERTSASRSARPSARPRTTAFIPSGDQSRVFSGSRPASGLVPNHSPDHSGYWRYRPARLATIRARTAGSSARRRASVSASTTGTAQASSVSSRADSARRSSSRAATSAVLVPGVEPSDRLAHRPGGESVRLVEGRIERAGGGRDRPACRSRSPPRGGRPRRDPSAGGRAPAGHRGRRRMPADRAAWRRTRAEASASTEPIARRASGPPIASSAQIA